MRSPAHILRLATLALFLVALDQTSKAAVLAWLPEDHSRVVIPGFFKLVHITNTGAAWGVLRGQNVTLGILSTATIVAILFFWRKLVQHPWQPPALAVILSGILGNLLDRVRHGAVVDFLLFHVGRWHWPAFNVADSAICVGLAFYVLASFRAERASHIETVVPGESKKP